MGISRIGRDDGGEHFLGKLDEIMIINRSFSPQQIQAFYSNRTDLIVSQETITGEQWHFTAIANNQDGDSAKSTSNTITIGMGDVTPTVPEWEGYGLLLMAFSIFGGFFAITQQKKE